MAFRASPADLLARVEKTVEAKLDDGWAAEPPAARAALIVREELTAWTRGNYPGSACEGTSLDPGSRRRLALTIHSAPVSHRVEVWGLACGDEAEAQAPAGEHVGGPCRHLNARLAQLEAAGLKRLEERSSPRLSLSLWMGAAAPDGCPACLAKG
jgi:hypothetical protein